jgi:VanZ like family
MTVRRLPPVARRALAVALAAWVALLALTLLSPSAAGPSRLVATVAEVALELGIPTALVDQTEFALNVAAFVPVSLLGSMLWPRLTWRDWTAGGFLASFLVEAVQAIALSGRSAMHSDVVSNTLGALVGAVVGALLMRGGAALGSSEDRADLPDRLAPTEQDHLPG